MAARPRPGATPREREVRGGCGEGHSVQCRHKMGGGRRERSQHLNARLPKGGACSQSSPISGIVTKGACTAIDSLREAFANRCQDDDTGMDAEGRAQALETGDPRLSRPGCRLFRGGSADKNDGSRHGDMVACGAVGNGPQKAQQLGTELAQRAGPRNEAATTATAADRNTVRSPEGQAKPSNRPPNSGLSRPAEQSDAAHGSQATSLRAEPVVTTGWAASRTPGEVWAGGGRR